MAKNSLELLIVSSRDGFAQRVADHLRGGGHECVRVRTLGAAVAMLDVARPDALVLDGQASAACEAREAHAFGQAVKGLAVLLLVGEGEGQPLSLTALATPGSWDDLPARLPDLVRQVHLSQTFGPLLQAGPAAGEPPSQMTPERFLALCCQNLAGTLADLSHLQKVRAEGLPAEPSGQREVCHLLNCPKLAELTEALAETVEVLDQTRTAFKSKELGQLRLRLQRLLRR